MACLIKTHSRVLSPASRMTSDQRISHVIIIRLWVVFQLFVSSHFAPLIAILILLLIGLSWFLTSLSWVFARSCLTQRSSDRWSSVNLSGLTRGSYFLNCLYVYLFAFFFYSTQLFQPQIFVSPIFIFCLRHFTFSQPHPSASLTFPDSAGRLYQNSNLSRP